MILRPVVVVVPITVRLLEIVVEALKTSVCADTVVLDTPYMSAPAVLLA